LKALLQQVPVSASFFLATKSLSEKEDTIISKYKTTVIQQIQTRSLVAITEQKPAML